jgi:hypothetical protein
MIVPSLQIAKEQRTTAGPEQKGVPGMLQISFSFGGSLRPHFKQYLASGG